MNTISISKKYRVLRGLLNIGFWICTACFLIFIIFIFVRPQSVGISFDGFTLSVIDGLLTKDLYPLFYLSIGVAYSVGIACLWLLKKMIQSIDNTPFTLVNVKSITMIGWLILIQAYTRQIIHYSLIERISAKAGASFMLQPRFELIPPGAFLALCVLVIAEIFRFGCTLQQEHDSTV